MTCCERIKGTEGGHTAFFIMQDFPILCSIREILHTITNSACLSMKTFLPPPLQIVFPNLRMGIRKVNVAEIQLSLVNIYYESFLLRKNWFFMSEFSDCFFFLNFWNWIALNFRKFRNRIPLALRNSSTKNSTALLKNSKVKCPY